MNKVLILAIALVSQFAFAEPRGIISPEECESVIENTYDDKHYEIYSIRPLLVGRGRYATHFNYEIKYIKDKKNKYTQEGCIAKIHCADYHFEIVTDLEHCGS